MPPESVHPTPHRNGRLEAAGQCATVTFGEIRGGGVTTVKSSTAALLDPGLLGQAVKLEVAKVEAWLRNLV